MNKNYTLIQQTRTVIVQKIDFVYRQVNVQIQQSGTTIIDKVEVVYRQLNVQIQQNRTLITEVNQYIRQQFSLISLRLNVIVDAIAGLAVTLGAIIEAIGVIELNINAGFALLGADLLRTQWHIDSHTNSVGKSVVKDIRSDLRKQSDDIKARLKRIEDKLDQLSKDQEECCEELPDRLGKVVGQYVVGDSWFRWDGTHTYYPTLCFKFKEIETIQYPRTSQIQIKLKKNNQSLTDADIVRLRSSVANLDRLQYCYGSNRGYFVAKNRRFKTTVYGDSREEIEKVLQACISVVEEEFDPNYLSYTDGVKRENVVKRGTPLLGVSTNPVNYKKPSTQELFRVLLLVNGMEQPIVIKD